MRKKIFFLAKFFAIFIVLQSIIVAFEPIALEENLASFEAYLLGLKSKGNSVYLEDVPFIITPNCSGLLSAAVFAAVVFSLSKPELIKKAKMAFFGMLSLFILNIGRLYAVLAIGKSYGIKAAEYAHVLSWFVMSIAVLAVWYMLVKRSYGKISDML